MRASDKIVLLRGGERRGAQQVVDALRRLATERLVRAATRTLDRGDDTLFERAERAADGGVQEDFFAAMRELRLQRRRVVGRFREQLEERFTRLARHEFETNGPQPRRSDELSLMEDHRLEEEVAVESTGARLRGRHASLFGTVEGRLASLLGLESVPAEVNPLHPHTIAKAFSVALADVEIALTARLILYKLLERVLDAELPAVWKAVDDRLDEAGARSQREIRSLGGERGSAVADDVNKIEAKHDGSDKPEEEQSAAADAESEHASRDDGIAEMLERLIGRMKYGRQSTPGGGWGGGPGGPGGGYGGGGSAGAVADARVVLRALTALQGDVFDAGEFDPDRVKAAVNSWLGERGHATVLERSVDDVIDIVSMLFEELFEDPRLCPALRIVIARLQIPVLKIALRDRRLFGEAEHPARGLINELAQAATGWTEPAELENDPLYNKVVEVVDRIVSRFRDDVQVFDVALRDFRYFMERERERARVVEERTRQTAEGNLKVEAARETVQTEVEARLQNDVPHVVRQLLEEAWFRVLFITAVREGRDGEAWRRQIAVMDQLLWSVVPKSDAGERQRMLQLMPRLLQDLREGLNGIMYNPHEMTRLFRDLEAVHIRCLSPEQAQPATAVPEPMPEEPDNKRSAPGIRAGRLWGERPADAEDIARIEALTEQTWFDLRDRNPSVRAKLSARLDGGRRYVFVNRAGFRVAEYGADELARALREGDVMELSEHVAFDYALEQVIETLKEMHGA